MAATLDGRAAPAAATAAMGVRRVSADRDSPGHDRVCALWRDEASRRVQGASAAATATVPSCPLAPMPSMTPAGAAAAALSFAAGSAVGSNPDVSAILPGSDTDAASWSQAASSRRTFLLATRQTAAAAAAAAAASAAGDGGGGDGGDTDDADEVQSHRSRLSDASVARHRASVAAREAAAAAKSLDSDTASAVDSVAEVCPDRPAGAFSLFFIADLAGACQDGDAAARSTLLARSRDLSLLLLPVRPGPAARRLPSLTVLWRARGRTPSAAASRTRRFRPCRASAASAAGYAARTVPSWATSKNNRVFLYPQVADRVNASARGGQPQ